MTYLCRDVSQLALCCVRWKESRTHILIRGVTHHADSSLRRLGLCGIASCLTASMPFAAETANNAPLALHVLNRLTFGPAPGQLAAVEKMGVDAFIDQQLHPERLALPQTLTAQLDTIAAATPHSAELVAELRDARQQKKADPTVQQSTRRTLYREVAEADQSARLLRAIESPRQLEEVMVDFWFNHFNVYAGKGQVRIYLSDYERDAIRPYVLGQFRDLLGATAHHPAMLFYLDNWLSTAPGFQPRVALGKPAKTAGLNENYAREVMELHTLGVDGGYTQQDVTELARMLTGWTFDPRGEGRDVAFVYDDRRHDHGVKHWLGHTVESSGQQEGEWALDVLASRPATGHHLAFELAQYFVADQPPPALVDRLAARFQATHGNIREVLATLFASSEFRDPAIFDQSFKTPYRYVISAVRAGGLPISNVRPLVSSLAQMGMPLFGCQTPDGYKVSAASWLTPDALSTRINFATALAAGRLPLDKPLAQVLADAAVRVPIDTSETMVTPAATVPADLPPGDRPPALVASDLLSTLGVAISVGTRDKIATGPDKLQAAMVLGSPDFMHH